MYKDPETRIKEWSCCKKFKADRDSSEITFWVGRFWKKEPDLVDERTMVEVCPYCKKRLPERATIDGMEKAA